MARSGKRCGIAAALLAMAAGAVQAQGWTITDLGPGWATGINDLGQVVGSVWVGSTGDSYAWQWNASSGLRTDLSATVLGGRYAAAHGINNLGAIVGTVTEYLNPTLVRTQGFVYRPGIGVSELYPGSEAFAINASAVVTGRYFDMAFRYYAAMDLYDFPAAPSVGYAIASDNTVVGPWQSHPWVGSGALTDRGGTATSINDAGRVAGYFSSGPANPPVDHAFVYDIGSGTFVDLGAGLASRSRGMAINLAGQVVGSHGD